jgi:hypothetical protein
MRTLYLTAVLGLTVMGWTGGAHADPDKDESGKGRGRGGYERSYEPQGRFYGDPGYREKRRERRAFKEEYDDGACKYERKLEKNGEYKEEMKCRSGYRPIRRY